MHYRLRLAVLCATTVVFSTLVGLLLGFIFFVPIVFGVFGAIVGIAYWFFACWSADRFALDAYDAQVVEAVSSPNLYKVVAKLASDAGIEPPLIYSLPYGPANAFAVARVDRSSVIVLSNTLMKNLDQDEVRSILALMVARIAEQDSAVCSIAATLAGIPYYFICNPAFRGWAHERMKVDPATGLCGLEKLLISLVLPITTFTLRLAFDDTLIKKADAMTVRLAGSGATLSSALVKIDREKPREWWGNSAYNPATGVLFAVSPLAYVDEMPSHDPYLIKTQRAFTAPFPPIDERSVLLMRGAEQSGGTAVPA